MGQISTDISGREGGGTFEVIGASESDAWMAVLARVAQHDVYHLPGYHRLAEYHGDGVAHLFVHRMPDYLIALPLLLRPVDESDPDGIQDATSVYGYPGPVASHPRIPERIVREFQAHLREECERRRVVAVFSRLHPLIEQDRLLGGLGTTISRGLTVSVDLTIPQQEQWAAYRKNLRRLVRRGLEAGVTCLHDRELLHMREWTEMYAETMERVGAPASYRFDAAHFSRMADELGSALHLFMAFIEGRAAAGGLFTICDGIVEAHLGASREEYSAYSPVRIVDDTARRWAAEAGAQVFHLGGGLGSRRDSLFRYKASFSKRRHEFTTWQWIVDRVAYDALAHKQTSMRDRAGGGDADPSYFPAYREPGGLPVCRQVPVSATPQSRG